MLRKRRPIGASEAAKMRGCSLRTLKRYAVDPMDDFPKPTMDRGHMVWDATEIEAWIELKFAARDKEQADIRRVLRFEQRAG